MILDKIVESTKIRVNELKKLQSLEEIKKYAESMPKDNAFAFEKALRKDGISFICEVKKASPSKGIIATEFPYIKIAEEYEKAGATCISVLTEPEFFLGSNSYLEEISKCVKVPILRKDFIIDSHQIYETKIIGGAAILLISSILETVQIRQYIEIADSLGLSTLVEAHTEEEVLSALKAGARILGVNNRNLKNFEVNFSNCIKLRALVPKEIIFVSESGIKNAQNITKLKDNNVDAVLIGEILMRSTNKKALLDEWRAL